MKIHEPVLLNELVSNLVVKRSGIYFDGTIGFGGHSEEILKSLDSNSRLLATDKDLDAYNYCKDKFKDDKRVSIFHTGFSSIESISKIEFIDKFDGIFADLGVSSFQLDNPNSGFSFREDGPLDLRMDKGEGNPASFILNKFSEEEIANIIFQFGEERRSRVIAKKIIEYRKNNKFETTFQLKSIVEEVANPKQRIKSLARVFQALRIYVNNELGELKEILKKSVDLLDVGGRIAIITFHSLEDRIVKDFFKYEFAKCVCPPEMPMCNCGKVQRLKIITRKPIIAGKKELNENRRSRSAKLRVAERI